MNYNLVRSLYYYFYFIFLKSRQVFYQIKYLHTKLYFWCQPDSTSPFSLPLSLFPLPANSSQLRDRGFVHQDGLGVESHAALETPFDLATCFVPRSLPPCPHAVASMKKIPICHEKQPGRSGSWKEGRRIRNKEAIRSVYSFAFPKQVGFIY